MSVAIITGASSGLGMDFAKAIAKKPEVDSLWLIARRTERLEALQKELQKPCKILPLDLSKAASLEEYQKLLQSENPEVSYLVNAAGFGKFGSYHSVPVETAFNMIDLNVKALVFFSQNTLPFMKENGRIIQMGSASTYNPLPYLNVYAATKSFVKVYSRALHRELKPRKITVTTVCPGWVQTEFFSRADIDTNSKKSFAKPMVSSVEVVKKAVRDADRGKDISMYGLFNKTHHFLAKILPHRLIMRLWMGMAKKELSDDELN